MYLSLYSSIELSNWMLAGIDGVQSIALDRGLVNRGPNDFHFRYIKLDTRTQDNVFTRYDNELEQLVNNVCHKHQSLCRNSSKQLLHNEGIFISK